MDIAVLRFDEKMPIGVDFNFTKEGKHYLLWVIEKIKNLNLFSGIYVGIAGENFEYYAKMLKNAGINNVFKMKKFNYVYDFLASIKEPYENLILFRQERFLIFKETVIQFMEKLKENDMIFYDGNLSCLYPNIGITKKIDIKKFSDPEIFVDLCRYYAVDLSQNINSSLFVTSEKFFEYLFKLKDYSYGQIMEYLNEYPNNLFFPKHLDIEITNNCGLKCLGCPRELQERQTGFMNFDVYKKTIKQIACGYKASIDFQINGEPFEHKDFINYLKWTVAEYPKIKKIYIYTNGLNLTREIMEELLNIKQIAGIIFNVDAVNKEKYKELKGYDLYEKVEKNILKLASLKKQKGLREPVIAVQIIKMKQTDDYIDEFFKKWDRQYKLKKQFDFEARKFEIRQLPENQRQKALGDLIKKFWDYFYETCAYPIEHVIIQRYNDYAGQIENHEVVDCAPYKRTICKQLEDGLVVLWNGDIVKCYQDFKGREILGNIQNDDLIDIYSQKIKPFLLKHKEEKYNEVFLCGSCKDWYIPVE